MLHLTRLYAYLKYGRTSLIKASEKGHEAIVRMLLERGADVNFKDRVSTMLL